MKINAAKIHKTLEDRKRTVEDLAEYMSVTPSAVYKLLKKGSTKEVTIGKIADFLHLKVQDIVHESVTILNESTNTADVYRILSDVQFRLTTVERELRELQNKSTRAK